MIGGSGVVVGGTLTVSVSVILATFTGAKVVSIGDGEGAGCVKGWSNPSATHQSDTQKHSTAINRKIRFMAHDTAEGSLGKRKKE